MKNILHKGIVWAATHKVIVGVILAATLIGGGYLTFRSNSTTTTETFSVVQAVGRGSVSSGIETTGEIVAAQKLDLDVYKQQSRIDAVNIKNGSHVEKGKVLISFDKSDANVDVKSAQVSVTKAELDLETAQSNVSDPSTDVRNKENEITNLEKSVADAHLNFLNEGLAIVPHLDDATSLLENAVPTLSGRYSSQEEGQYTIEVYGSLSSTGLSFRLMGLEENYVASISLNKTLELGNRGLKISFPSDTRVGETWIVKVPNTDAGTYNESKANYEKTIKDLQIDITNAKQELVNLKQADTGAHRNLKLEQAELTLAEAKQKLSENYDAIKERDIVAPFTGSIQDMLNVVVGATPTGGSEDSISLGTLVSDDYLIKFALDAADVAKVSVGQKVKVSVTSYANKPTFDAIITEVSSLPAQIGVAQYDVSALLDYDARTSQTVLREGMLADVLVVQEEKENALRVPTSAISYTEGHPTVRVVDSLTAEQQTQFKELGIVRTNGVELASYPVTVELGVKGRFYTEIVSGLDEGTLILTTTTVTEPSGGATVQQGFGQRQDGGNVRVQNGGGGASVRSSVAPAR